MNISREDSESTDLPSTSNGVTRRPTLLAIIKENNEPNVSPASPPGEVHPMDKEEGQTRDIQEKDQYGSTINGAEVAEDHDVRKIRPRQSLSSYAAPTKASEAKKTDKGEAFGRPVSTRPRPYSTHDNWRVSPRPRSDSTFRNFRSESASSHYSPELILEQENEAPQMQHCSVDLVDSQKDADADAAEIVHIWKQKEEEGKRHMRKASEHEHLEKEETRKRLEELETERDEARELRDKMRRELEVTKDQVVSLRQQNDQLVDMIGGLEAASIARNKQTEVKLQSFKADAERWKRKYEELSINNQELKDKIEPRNLLEPKFPLMEKEEAENRKILVTVTQKEEELVKTQSELKKVQKSLEEIREYAEEKDNEAYESNERLQTLQKFMNNMSEVMTKWAQVASNDSRVGLGDMDNLIQSYADYADTTELLVNTRNLLEEFVEKHELLESQVEDKIYEITNIRKAVEEERKDAAQLSPGAMMSPGLMGPQSSLLHDREGFESLYKKELAKRKAAEEKVQEISTAKEQQSQLRHEKEELESRLKKVLEENEILCKQAEHAKLQADLCLDESEQSKLELDKRSTGFQSYKDQLEKEKDQYIKDYRTEAQDKSRWEAANLHKQLEDQEREYNTLKQEFDRSKATNARWQDEIASLEQKCMIQSKHIINMERAFFLGGDLPTLPNLEDEHDSEHDSESDAFSSSSLFPSFAPPKPNHHGPPIPRYELPDAVAARKAKVEAYRAELKAKTEEELFDFNFKAPRTRTKKNRAAADDIMEKVRKWSLAARYPPSKREWSEMRSTSAWERWEGEKWAVQCNDRKDLEILRKRGLLED